MVVVDYWSKWVELFPTCDSKTPKIARILIEEVFTRWGTPKYLLLDRGSQFTSHLLNEVCKVWGVVNKLTTSYHPQTNLTERTNQTLKRMIASYVEMKHDKWDQWLHEFRFAINSSFQESTGFSPALLHLGRPLKGPLEQLLSVAPAPHSSRQSLLERQQTLSELVEQNVSRAQEKQAKYYNRRRQDMHFDDGDAVWRRAHPLSDASKKFSTKLAPKWNGPYKIVKRLGPVNYKVSSFDGTFSDTIHVANVKPYFGTVPSKS